MSRPTHTALEISSLTDHQSYERLLSTAFGRVALSSGALPVIFPIHYAMLDFDPVFRTDPGTTLMSASNGQVLCLEIDEIHPTLHTGWSVLVTGRADVLDDPEDVAAAAALPLRPWIGQGDAFVRIRAAMVTGREIRPASSDQGPFA